MTRRAVAVAMLVVLPLACRSAPRAAGTAGPKATRSPVEALAYVELQTSDGTGTAAANLPGVILKAIERELGAAQGPLRTGVVGSAPADGVAYRVLGVLQQQSAVPGAQTVAVGCEMSFVIFELPTEEMKAFAKGSATVATPPSQLAGGLEDCVAAVTADVVKKHVVPFVRLHARARVAVKRSDVTASGRGFQVAVPVGWSAHKGALGRQVEQEGGVLLVAPSSPGRFQASLVILPVPREKAADVTTEAECQALGTELEPVAQIKVDHTGWIELPTGKSCQIYGASLTNSGHHGTNTLITGDRAHIMATCNHDAADELMPLVCDGVLRSLVLDR